MLQYANIWHQGANLAWMVRRIAGRRWWFLRDGMPPPDTYMTRYHWPQQAPPGVMYQTRTQHQSDWHTVSTLNPAAMSDVTGVHCQILAAAAARHRAWSVDPGGGGGRAFAVTRERRRWFATNATPAQCPFHTTSPPGTVRGDARIGLLCGRRRNYMPHIRGARN